MPPPTPPNRGIVGWILAAIEFYREMYGAIRAAKWTVAV